MNVTALPVHWGRFWVECREEQKVALYRETLAEQQSDHFIIERSTEGQKWEAIGIQDLPMGTYVLLVEGPGGMNTWRFAR